MQGMFCPITGQDLEKLGTNKGKPVFYCDYHDTRHEPKPNHSIIMGTAPCPKEGKIAHEAHQRRD